MVDTFQFDDARPVYRFRFEKIPMRLVAQFLTTLKRRWVPFALIHIDLSIFLSRHIHWRFRSDFRQTVVFNQDALALVDLIEDPAP